MAQTRRRATGYDTPCRAPLRLMRFMLLVLAARGVGERSAAPAASGVASQFRLVGIDSIDLRVLVFVTSTDSTFLAREVVTLRDDGVASFVDGRINAACRARRAGANAYRHPFERSLRLQ